MVYGQISIVAVAIYCALLTLFYALLWVSFALHKKQNARKIKKLESTLSVLSAGSVGMGQKMLSLEKKLSQLCKAQDEMKVSDLNFSYTQAQQLIAQGVDSDAIAANSGLSASEINLMQLLYQREPQVLARKFQAPGATSRLDHV